MACCCSRKPTSSATTEARASSRASVSVTIPLLVAGCRGPSREARRRPRRASPRARRAGAPPCGGRRRSGASSAGANLPLNARRRSSWKRPGAATQRTGLERRDMVERSGRIEHRCERGEVERHAAVAVLACPREGLDDEELVEAVRRVRQTAHRAQREGAPGGDVREVQEPVRLAVRADRERVQVVARSVGRRVLEGHREPGLAAPALPAVRDAGDRGGACHRQLATALPAPCGSPRASGA